jgi:DNA repair photolyase
LQVANEHGAHSAGYTLLRLPYELKDLFKDWLSTHYPLKAEHVMSRLREMRGGRENDPNFGSRFRKACERLGMNQEEMGLDTEKFIRPNLSGQGSLF